MSDQNKILLVSGLAERVGHAHLFAAAEISRVDSAVYAMKLGLRY